MLVEAAHDAAGVRPSLTSMLAAPRIARYVAGWGRDGDVALVAEGAGPLGAAWYRLFTAEEPGFGFIDDETPELSIAVVPERRGEGIGSALLGALVERAREDGHGALSLSVSPNNPAASLYVRLGFVRVESRDEHWTMRLDLALQSGRAARQ
jgi:ribosomal protein S18 acetylase RimI-like enzyme